MQKHKYINKLKCKTKNIKCSEFYLKENCIHLLGIAISSLAAA